MKRMARLLFQCWVIIMLAGAASSFAAPGNGNGPKDPKNTPPKYSADTILVKPKKGVPPGQLDATHGKLGARATHTFKWIGNLQIVKLPKGQTVEAAIKEYQASGLVEYAEPDYEVYAVLTPNDPQYLDGTLWGMNNTGQNAGTADADIDAPEAWNVRTNANPVIVAVIDTGVRYTHEDLAANMWVNPGEIPGNGIDDDGDGVIDDVYGFNAIANSGDPMDDNGHGTHCSGTIGGVGNNGKGVVGVAWNVRIMACKFLSSGGSGSTSDAIKCIDFARTHGAKVMSNSWGGGGADQSLQDAITAARNADIIFVAAAGNSSLNNDTSSFYPANYPVENIISVAATDRNDLLASFSNYGLNSVELGAPGVSIYSTYNSSDSAYATLSGTSMATPHVAGAVALLRAQFPSDTYLQIIHRLTAATDPIPSLAGKTITGGRLNIFKALTLDPIADFTADPMSGSPPLTVAFVDDSFGTITSRSLDFGDGSPATSNTTTTHVYNATGSFNAALTVIGPGGTNTKTRAISASPNYILSPDTYSWIDPSAMTAISLTDDSYSTQALPFTFTFYGQNFTTLYVSSNGTVGFAPDGMTAYANTDLPNSSTPNNFIAAYWDDLNPGVGGQVRIGTIGSAPNRTVVISWVGVPLYGDNLATLSFQILLIEGSNDIKLQYLEVQAGRALGAGASATVGVENSGGTVARKYSYNTVSLSNSQAMRFSMNAAPPAGALSVTPATGLSSSGNVGGPFSPSSQQYTLSNTGGQSIDWTASKAQAWVTLSATSGTLAAGSNTTVTVSINANANALAANTYTDTVSFNNTSNGNGSTTRGVSLVVSTPPPPGALSVTPVGDLTSSGTQGGPFSPSSQQYTLSNTGGQSINWTASKAQTWVTLSSAGGSLLPGSNTTVTVSINSNANALTPSNYTDTVSFNNTSNGNGNTTRGVSLTVNAPPPGSLAVVPTTTLSSSGNQGGPFSPSNQVYTLANTGGQPINWTASKAQTWVTLSSVGGSLLPGSNTTVTVSINSNANALTPSNYTDTVSFNNTSNGNGNTTRGVSLTVNPPLPPPGALSVSPAGGLSSSGNVGGPFSPSNQVYTLSNTGGQSINWTASKAQAWTTLSATSGTLAAGSNVTVTVSINSNANALGAGGYSDTVSFNNTSNGSGNTTRGVSLTVNSLPLSAPSNLTAGVSGSSRSRRVDLNWNDNSSGEVRFEIHRATGGGAFSLLTTVGANVTTYRDTSVSRGVTYRYEVRACDNSNCSGFSNIAQTRVQ